MSHPMKHKPLLMWYPSAPIDEAAAVIIEI